MRGIDGGRDRRRFGQGDTRHASTQIDPTEQHASQGISCAIRVCVQQRLSHAHHRLRRPQHPCLRNK